MKKIMALCSFFFFIYSIVPTVFLRSYSKKIIKQTEEKGILLTFDDGPNPLYTGRLLNILQQYEVKAIFFVVAKKAQQYPDLIRRMKNEGHIIGIHHYTHRSSFLLTPWSLKKQLQQSQNILEHILEEGVHFYRPPYGHFNAAAPFIAKDFQVMSWSGMFGDWKRKTAQTKLEGRLENQRADGEIFVLHDCGKNLGADYDAPKYMLQALESFLQKNKDQPFVNAKKWSEQLLEKNSRH